VFRCPRGGGGWLGRCCCKVVKCQGALQQSPGGRNRQRVHSSQLAHEKGHNGRGGTVCRFAAALQQSARRKGQAAEG
jgi:hypothetical protein